MPETLKQVAYAHVRRKIFAGEFGGDGRVSEWAVSRELGMSRGPIREAVNQLVTEGLLKQTPHVGTFVRTADREEIEQLCDLRMALEVFAAGKAAKRIRGGEIARLRKHMDDLAELGRSIIEGRRAWDPTSHEAMYVADSGIHQALLEAARVPLVRKMAENTQVLSLINQRSTQSLEWQLRDMEQHIAVHRRLVEAVCTGDAKAARHVMNEHLSHVKKELLELYDHGQHTRPSAPAVA